MPNAISPFIQLQIPNHLNFLAPAVCDDLIRIGRKNDGGYVVPHSILNETEVLVSCGVNDDWSFESGFLSINQRLIIHAYDHTISNTIFFKNIIRSMVHLFLGKSTLSYIRSRVQVWRSYKKFFQGNTKHFRERLHNRKDDSQDVTTPTIFDRLGASKVFIKLDIEGGEYRVIDEFVALSSKIVGMVIEFHDTDPLRLLFINAVKKLQRYYTLVHIHANNCGPISNDGLPEVLELTFVRKDFCSHSNRRSKLPIEGLDEPNDPDKVDYALTFSL
jgi:hypothetical protein